MLVDRILSVEGEKRSLGSGRVITEHDVLPISPTARVFVNGSAADDMTKQCGGWTVVWPGDGSRKCQVRLGCR